MKRFDAVGAYIYAGGFTLGMQKHFHILAHLEDGPFGVDTVRHNLPGIPVYENPEEWPLDELKSADVVYCNPPCAPWSAAGSGGPVGQDRTVDHMQALSLLESLSPTIWVWESVTQAYIGKHDGLSKYVTDYGMSKGYSVYHFLHDVKFMGLPQQRRRLFTILSKVRINFPMPLRYKGNFKTVAEALDEVADDPGWVQKTLDRYKDTLRRTPEGYNLRKIWLADGNEPPGPMWMMYRLKSDGVSGTQIGTGHFFHPKEDRMLGHREVQVLCGYPAWYEFSMNNKAGPYVPQIARAVTPPAGDYLGSVLYDSLVDNHMFEEPEEWEINYMGVNNRVQTNEMLTEVKRLQ